MPTHPWGIALHLHWHHPQWQVLTVFDVVAITEVTYNAISFFNSNVSEDFLHFPHVLSLTFSSDLAKSVSVTFSIYEVIWFHVS